MSSSEDFRRAAARLTGASCHPNDREEMDSIAALLREAAEMREEAAKQFDAYDGGQSAHTTVGHLRAILSRGE